MLLRTTKTMLLLFVLFNAAVAASALPSDLRLIQMVPPESQVVASMLRPTPEGQPSRFLLITIYNRLDLEDFYALTGADASRLIHQVVFVAAMGGDGKLSEHSLLISGHFNRDAILRSAESGKATTESYRGQSILVVPPLARERDRFKQVRWLAILNSDIAIFGTPVSVQHELDQQIANSRPDPMLMERLSCLGRDDETWFLLPAPSSSGFVESVLEKLDPKLGAVAREGGPMQFGIHIGRRVEITASSNIAARGNSNSEDDRPAAQLPPAHSFLAGSQVGADGDGKEIAAVKISRRRYDEWLDKFSKGSITIGGTPPH
jgi:hypothetical protein